jgi:hypothetical protein
VSRERIAELWPTGDINPTKPEFAPRRAIMTDNIPTLTDVVDAEDLLRELAETHEWVSVFWDRGWGASGQVAEISIIVDGDGQQPKARITKSVYAALVDAGTVGENTLMTFKARRIHDFKTPPKQETVGPDNAEITEDVVRQYLAAHPDQPIEVEFCRGLSRGPYGPQVDHEYLSTPAIGKTGRFVLLLPGFDSAAISAQEPGFLGPEIIGGGVADSFSFPMTANGESARCCITCNKSSARPRTKLLTLVPT